MTFNIDLKNIRIFHGISSVPKNTLVDMNNVVLVDVGQQLRMFMTSSSVCLDQYDLNLSQHMVKCASVV